MGTPFAAMADLDDDCQSDANAVLRHVFAGAELDPQVIHRVDEKAARITERIRQVHGMIDDAEFQAIMAEDDA